jgi:phosphatidylglycerol lysyltransferase
LLFIDDARRKGQSPAKAAAGTLFVVFAELLGVALMSLAGLNLLLSSNSLKHEAIVGVIVLIAFLIFLFFVLTFGVWAPKLLKLFIFKIAEWVNKAAIALRFKFRISREQAEGNADELISASQALKAHPIYAMQTIGISLFMFVILIGALALLFPAFGQDITTSEGLHRLCAGFVVGMLFWIVSPTPQGIGVVEIAMAVTFYKLGMPYPTALLIALSFRIISFWIPMICGVFFLKNLGSNATEPPTKRSLAVTGIAFTICLMGIIDVVSAVHPGVLARARFLHEHLPLEITRGSRLASALAGFALLLLSRGLWRRKRTAWILASVALFISIITHLIKGLDYEEASLATILLIWLASQRSKFYASSDPPSVAQALRVALASIVFTMAYGVLGLWILDNYFKVNYGLWAAIKQVFTMFVTFDGGGLIPVSPHGFGAYFRSSIYGVGAGTLIYTLLMILRPIIYRMPASDSERKKATGISQNFGKSPLARYALFNDKSYYFSEGGSMIAYAVVGRTVVALGDPIGPRDDAETSILGFTKYCRGNDWRVGFYQTLPDYIPSYKDMGYKCICIGHDAIVNLDDFSLAGGSNKQIRWSVNRFAKLGYKAEILNPPYSAELISKLRSVSDEWLLSMNGAEKRFSLGWFDEEYLQSCRILVVLDPDLQVTAFANILPTYGDNETTIDLMRRRDNAENYTMEFLFVKLL